MWEHGYHGLSNAEPQTPPPDSLANHSLLTKRPSDCSLKWLPDLSPPDPLNLNLPAYYRFFPCWNSGMVTHNNFPGEWRWAKIKWMSKIEAGLHLKCKYIPLKGAERNTGDSCGHWIPQDYLCNEEEEIYSYQRQSILTRLRDLSQPCSLALMLHPNLAQRVPLVYSMAAS